MEYFKLIYDYNHSSNAGYIEIVDSNLPFSRFAVNELKPLSVNKVYCEVIHDNISNFDFIANSLIWLIVSQRIKDIFESCNLGKYEFIPVLRSDTTSLVGYLFHCMNIIDALDEENSMCQRRKYFKDGVQQEYLSVIKYAVKKDMICNFDVFKIIGSEVPIFISSHLINKLAMHKAIGFDFSKIKIT